MQCFSFFPCLFNVTLITDVAKVATSSQNVKIIAMRSINILLVAFAALMSSCSVYRSGQTPDDVYFSPAREQEAYVQVNNSPDRYGSSYNESMPSDDHYLRMKTLNPRRWSAFDNYNYYNDWSYAPYSPYNNGFGLNYGFGYGNINPYYGYSYNNYYNSYMNWNNYYNPYYSSVVIVNPKTNPAGYTTLRNFNAGSYRNTNYNSAVNRRLYAPSSSNLHNVRGNNSTLGSSMRRIFSGSNSARSSGNTYTTPNYSDRPVRSYTPSSNNNNYSSGSTRSNSSGSSSSSSSGSSGSSSGSRPSRR